MDTGVSNEYMFRVCKTKTTDGKVSLIIQLLVVTVKVLIYVVGRETNLEERNKT